ncbi:RNA polymerase subunit sigma-70 [Mesorhizobium sp. ES1-1]|uniref:RNA polymerase subunit sigma-70 n=1 Tax=Mesorhizobium sp. ES1-1 TaxID=2876629 RepID=UPI001CCD0E94|nr:RNA polymerase subunit sigma-70 [Mesorhizobium sp. ES1-1]MBZ9676390.1 RNA polymerase subunit sigma-70 [Mesorhizobium sp. ES1-1]
MNDDPGSSGLPGATGRPILDRSTFERLTLTHRRELKLHCYRMMGSLNEADDLVQETFLKAWRSRSQFDGRGSPRSWLYRIATNACLNAVKSRSSANRILVAANRPPTEGRAAAGPAPELAWLEPYPDSELPDLIEGEPGPEARYESREAVRLAFVAAIQHLPPRQRAALLLCDVLGWSALETAHLLGGSVASVNGALQRARRSLALRYPSGRPLQRIQPDPEEGRLLERYMQAWQAANLSGFIELLREDATYHMPPWRDWYRGRAAIHAFFETVWRNFDGYRAVATRANGQNAVAIYARRTHQPEWLAQSLHIMELADGGIVSLAVYVGPLGPGLFSAFGLPPTWREPHDFNCHPQRS